MLKLNTIVPTVFMRELAKPMCARKEGLVINILSSACLFANEFIAEYSASKAALDLLTKIFRKEVRKDHVRVCSVYPGGTNTSFRSSPRPDYMPPEAVANAVLSVISADPNTALDEIVVRPFVEMNF
jgi:short-subunit dehydrogenase